MTVNGSYDFSGLLREYVDGIRPTDRLPDDNLRPVLMGLFGEVGSVMAPAKKLYREKEAYPGYRATVEEEFGDTLWYFAALCRRIGQDLQSFLLDALNAQEQTRAAPSGDHVAVPSTVSLDQLDDVLLDMGGAASSLLGLRIDSKQASLLLQTFARTYLQALQAANIDFSRVVRQNLSKVRGRFVEPGPEALPTFDSMFHEDERLPDHFEIKIKQRSNGQSCLQWNGVFIGDPLSDNIVDPDGFRFHDVFHFAHAAMLHWSPTFRALIKHKRKSNPAIEEAQDSGRAIVVEEGLTALLFSRAKEMNFFESQAGVSFDLLKIIQQFVKGYEVDACPLKLWEDTILQGYSVFRKVRHHNGGIITGDRSARTLSFRPPSISI